MIYKFPLAKLNKIFDFTKQYRQKEAGAKG